MRSLWSTEMKPVRAWAILMYGTNKLNRLISPRLFGPDIDSYAVFPTFADAASIGSGKRIVRVEIRELSVKKGKRK